MQVDPSELFLPDARGRPDTEDEAQLHKSLKKLKNLPAQHDKVGRILADLLWRIRQCCVFFEQRLSNGYAQQSSVCCLLLHGQQLYRATCPLSG